MTNQTPELIIFVGPMFSSKTSKLLMTLERFRYQKKNIVIFKPKIDTRYSNDQVVSHSGWRVPAVTIESGEQILEYLQALDEKPDVVAIDEMFMIEGAGALAVWLFRELGTTVVVSSLDLSYSGRVFSEVEKVLPWATYIEKCSAVCVVCGADAYYTHKKADDENEIKVGGAEIYEPRCFNHHLAINLTVKS